MSSASLILLLPVMRGRKELVVWIAVPIGAVNATSVAAARSTKVLSESLELSGVWLERVESSAG